MPTNVLLLRGFWLIVLVSIILWYFWSSRPKQQGGDTHPSNAWHTSHAQSVTETIMQQGGPQLPQEYFFLFPEACPQCGNRIWQKDVRLPPSPHTKEREAAQIASQSCPRCGYGDTFASSGSGHVYTISSPFLTDEQASSIPAALYGMHATVFGVPLPYNTTTMPLSSVILENDDTTPLDVVRIILTHGLGMPLDQAEACVQEAHTIGRSCLMVLPQEQAVIIRNRFMEIAREHGFPLTITLATQHHYPSVQVDSPC